MITHHRQVSQKKFGPPRSLVDEVTADVWSMDLMVDGRLVPGRSRVPERHLERTSIMLSVRTYEELDDGLARFSVVVKADAPRSEVVATWEKLAKQYADAEW